MLLCLGINHRSTPIELRERMAFAESKLADAARQIKALPGLEESTVLSTCNRVELYVASHPSGPEDPSPLFHHLQAFLLNHFDLQPADLAAAAPYQLHGRDAARHLFRVASGLDSMVLGETEILGQVKKAYATAHSSGTTAAQLNQLFQKAFSAGKAVRSRTLIQQGATSVGNVAVELAEKIFGRLDRCQVMLVGAGEMSRTTAQSLVSRGASGIVVSNRSYDRALELASSMGGTALHFDAWQQAVRDADILISSTGAPHIVLHADQLREAQRARKQRPLFLIDIAVPRDIDPEAARIGGIYLYDIDALQAIADEARKERGAQIAACEAIIEARVNDLMSALAHHAQAAASSPPTPRPSQPSSTHPAAPPPFTPSPSSKPS
jgi:glutamyl-tRNA reductase